MAVVFCDSFAHYNTAGIPLKYSTAGGSIQSTAANVRTGPQSLQISSSSAPSIQNFNLPADITQTYASAPVFFTFAVGLAYKTGDLSGRIFTLKRNLSISPTPAETLLYLVLNSDGSLSLLTSGAAVVGSSAPGVITVGKFYYITLSANLLAGVGTTFAKVNLVDCATLAAGVDVISVTGFSLIDSFVDELDFGGPTSGSAWVNDFYFEDLSDGSVYPFAPNILACLPNGVGTALNEWDFTSNAPWQPNAANFALVNTVPQDESVGIQWNVGYLATSLSPQTDETYTFDTSALPAGRTIDSIQAVLLWEFLLALTQFSDTIPLPIFQQNGDGVARIGFSQNVHSLTGNPFSYRMFVQPIDPFSNPWVMADWKSGVWQAGPTQLTNF